MSDIKETIYYKELRAGDIIQEGDEWWPKDGTGQWQAYHQGMFGLQVLDASIARRPIRATHQTTFEEVPGTRTLQQTVEQPQRERWAYEELQPNDLVQDGDQWLNPNGRWQAIVLTPEASMEVGDNLRVRRPHNITMMLAAFANQAEVLAEVRADEKRLFDDLELLRSEYMKLQKERDEARAEVERLSTAVKSAQRARNELQLQVDELQADRRDEPTARQVQDMLRTWATELDWSGCCFDSAGRDKVSAVQRVLVSVIERIGSMIDPEGTSADT